MSLRPTRRSGFGMALIVGLLLGIMPLTALASSHHTATRTPVAFTSTVIEVIDPGEEWVDEAGIYHLRGQVQIEEVTGDITGTATLTVNVDSQPLGECTDEVCYSYSTVWVHVVIATEGGGWEGTYISESQDLPGEEFFADYVVLQGRGANAGMDIVASSVDGGPDFLAFEGTLSTMATPMLGLNTNVQLCADQDFNFAGGYISSGALEGSGGATAEFLVAGTEFTHHYALAGLLTLSDAHGSVTLTWAGDALDLDLVTSFVSHTWGHFVVVEGTGAYADLFGHGRIVATAGDAGCASGFGVRLSLIGEAHVN